MKVEYHPVALYWYNNISSHRTWDFAKFMEWLKQNGCKVIYNANSIVFDTEEDYVVFKLKYDISFEISD